MAVQASAAADLSFLVITFHFLVLRLFFFLSDYSDKWN